MMFLEKGRGRDLKIKLLNPQYARFYYFVEFKPELQLIILTYFYLYVQSMNFTFILLTKTIIMFRKNL